MTRILDGVKVGDAVIVTSFDGYAGTRRQIREVDYVGRVFRNVLQTKGGLVGVEISTGHAPKHYGSVTVAPATDADIAEVLREIEERKLADEAEKARQEAERIAARRIAALRGEISLILSMWVPEDVLVRALAVLRGEV